MKKNIKKQESLGRSMVEMLGVLAVIGVLSVGGILAYRYAMDYFEADQIANEMNLMRTDAKLKLSTGAEQLKLGSPYDDAHIINFNGYGTDYNCLDWDGETDITTAPFAPCHEASAYFIEVKQISAGVCKPLGTLLSGMDEKILLTVNDEAFKSGLCTEVKNDLTVFFALEPHLWGAEDNPAEDDNACETDDDCDEDTHCIGGECAPCGESEQWDNVRKKCVECVDNTECAEANKPVCDLIEGVCRRCENNAECENGKICDLAEGSATEGQCVCEQWDEELNKCIPQECSSNDDCLSDKYFCQPEKRSGTVATGTVCFCNFLPDNQDINIPDFKGSCQKISDYSVNISNNQGRSYIASNMPMSLMEAITFCHAQGKRIWSPNVEIQVKGPTNKCVKCTECEEKYKRCNNLKQECEDFCKSMCSCAPSKESCENGNQEDCKAYEQCEQERESVCETPCKEEWWGSCSNAKDGCEEYEEIKEECENEQQFCSNYHAVCEGEYQICANDDIACKREMFDCVPDGPIDDNVEIISDVEQSAYLAIKELEKSLGVIHVWINKYYSDCPYTMYIYNDKVGLGVGLRDAWAICE